MDMYIVVILNFRSFLVYFFFI